VHTTICQVWASSYQKREGRRRDCRRDCCRLGRGTPATPLTNIRAVCIMAAACSSCRSCDNCGACCCCCRCDRLSSPSPSSLYPFCTSASVIPRGRIRSVGSSGGQQRWSPKHGPTLAVSNMRIVCCTTLKKLTFATPTVLIKLKKQQQQHSRFPSTRRFTDLEDLTEICWGHPPRRQSSHRSLALLNQSV
jgi:hypothetical protein